MLLDAEGHACLADLGLSEAGKNEPQGSFTPSPEYSAPEMLKNEPFGEPVDWWALGILVFEMLVGLPPFYHHNPNRLYEKIMTANLHPRTTSPHHPSRSPACTPSHTLAPPAQSEPRFPKPRAADGSYPPPWTAADAAGITRWAVPDDAQAPHTLHPLPGSIRPSSLYTVMSRDRVGVQELTTALLHKEPQRRLGSGDEGADAIYAHPFFRPLDFERVARKGYTPAFTPEPSRISPQGMHTAEFSTEPSSPGGEFTWNAAFTDPADE